MFVCPKFSRVIDKGGLVAMMFTLDKAEPGTMVKVVRIGGKGGVRRRILDLGIVNGTGIEILRRAPMGDPVEFRFRGYNLSLRKTEAILIEVVQLE